jgi:hypothetical protein
LRAESFSIGIVRGAWRENLLSEFVTQFQPLGNGSHSSKTTWLGLHEMQKKIKKK